MYCVEVTVLVDWSTNLRSGDAQPPCDTRLPTPPGPAVRKPKPEMRMTTVETTDAANHHMNPTEHHSVPPGRRLRAALQAAGVGVGTRWTEGGVAMRELERLSGGRVSRATWGRLVGPVDAEGNGYLCEEDTFIIVCETLAKAGVPATTIAKCKQAYVTDRRVKDPTYRFKSIETGASAAELVLSVIEGLPDPLEQRRFLEDLAGGLRPELRVALMQAIAAAFGANGGGTNNDGAANGATGPSSTSA
jgi:hypothetical protein